MKKALALSFLLSSLISVNVNAKAYHTTPDGNWNYDFYTPPAESGMVNFLITPISWGYLSNSNGTKDYQDVRFAIRWGNTSWEVTGWTEGQRMRADLNDCLLIQAPHWKDDSYQITFITNGIPTKIWQGKREVTEYNNCRNVRHVRYGSNEIFD